jgi:hypothetical protein
MGYAPAARGGSAAGVEGATADGASGNARGRAPGGFAAASDLGSDHFHNVHLDPASFDHYAETGRFPEGAMLAMVVHPAVRGAAPSRRGWVEGARTGLEVAVKDSRRFEGGWAYFDFTGGGGSLRPAARPFPPAACAACHAAHAEKDNVFVQFYPVLRELDARRAASADRDRERSVGPAANASAVRRSRWSAAPPAGAGGAPAGAASAAVAIARAMTP